MIKINFNGRPKLTRKHLDFLIKYKDAYCVSISEEKYDELICKMKEDKDIDRYDENQKCYEIFDENLYIGDILFYDNEISILIFDEYANKDYEFKAIKLFLEKYYLDIQCFKVVIRKGNGNIEIVEKLLLKLGFEMKYISSTGNHVWKINR